MSSRRERAGKKAALAARKLEAEGNDSDVEFVEERKTLGEFISRNALAAKAHLLHYKIMANKRIGWPSDFGLAPLPSNTNKQISRLYALPAMRPLQFREGLKSLPPPFGHATSLASAMLYRRGAVMSEPCLNCAKGNGRFQECVRIVEPGKVWELDFFSGGCAAVAAPAPTASAVSQSVVFGKRSCFA